MRRLHLLLLPLAIAALLACSCSKSDGPSPVRTALQSALAAKPPAGVSAAVWKDVRAFYQQRQGKRAWVGDEYTVEDAASALAVLRTARAHGFDPEEYGESAIVQLHDALMKSDKKSPDRPQQLAEFEVHTTAGLLALGHDVALGRTRPTALDGRWKARRKAPDFAGTLVRAVDDDVKKWLDTIRPPHPEYAALEKAYLDLLGQKEKGGWTVIPPGVLKQGQSSPAAGALRQRLVASGQALAVDQSSMFDDSVAAAVKAFQELHGIKATGIVDADTRAALNVPIDERLRQVALNLERWRWMPDDLGERHLLVNIPSFHLIAREHGKPMMDIRVVVGKRGNETPIFSDEMETVVFSPYWNIPDSIKQGETAPAVVRDPAYLDRNNIEVFRGSRRVDPASIDWSDPGALREFTFRQRPGANNALGHVKFLFPNDFDVYLHDTPADSLFGRVGRAFSHGCIRVEEPEALANYVLRDYPEWDDSRIVRAMHSSEEQHVRLKEPIPVHITYFTSWVDENGGLHFQPDIYGYDAKQANE
jgi:murein L,D-transpeptidase YcbB/YkuD